MVKEHIPFGYPSAVGREIEYVIEAINSRHISGNGRFTKMCHDYFKQSYAFQNVLLTTSCSSALEMSAILLDIKEGDEVIMPSLTFVSTANAFILRGAKIIFADSSEENPNIDPIQLKSLISSRTKAIVVVHYAGIACDMDPILQLAREHNVYVVEDAAHSIDSFYQEKRLGSLGDLATFSFHETKNITAGEGGLLVINDSKFNSRAEIIWEKGTNRIAHARGEVNKYEWLDLGSSFVLSELNAAFLFGQLEQIEKIQSRRKKLWQEYYDGLKILEEQGRVRLPHLPSYATINGHIFYLLCENKAQREALRAHLNKRDINAVFHYLPLHESPYFRSQYRGAPLPRSVYYSDCLLRLPLYYSLTDSNHARIISETLNFFES
jgi:dTDP-4-amino-4,6-dideoxygalactose transaminase